MADGRSLTLWRNVEMAEKKPRKRQSVAAMRKEIDIHLKNIDTSIRKMKKLDQQMAPMLRELRRFVDE